MILTSLILIPFIFGIIAFFAGNNAKNIALLGSIISLVVSLILTCNLNTGLASSVNYSWMPNLGAQFSLYIDGMSAMLCLLTSIVMVLMLFIERNKNFENTGAYYGLLMLSQAGLIGVFLASDALLFYFFWELALIPIYFLCSKWGREKRIQVTYKFFVYTFLGSLMMLAVLIYLSSISNGVNAMSIDSIIAAGRSLPEGQQNFLFVLFFLAFAIKMPIFPLHTWQPDTYEQAPTHATIILSALMVKMGLYGVIRWVSPTLPYAFAGLSDIIMTLCVIGIVYASLMAMVQNNLKRLVAYSSIAHMGLMCAAVFAGNSIAEQGVMVQMFNHGINITAMWIMVSLIEQRFETLDMNKMGGLAGTVPMIAIALVVISYANIALPLTNGFVGEFMLFTGIFKSASPYHILFMVVAGLGVILSAAYTLSMVQKVAYGNNESSITTFAKLKTNECIVLILLIAIIVILGVYPQPLIDLINIKTAL